MRQHEMAEIQRRAELIANGSIEALHRELGSLQARNAEKGRLRSGATVKESARIAEEIIRQYFAQLEEFARVFPSRRAGFDVAILDAVSHSTRKLLDELWDGLRKTAALVRDEALVVHIQPQVEAGLVAAQETFRSNLRAYWAVRAPTLNVLFAVEVIVFAASLAVAVLWALDPRGPYDAWIALFGLAGVGIELYRRMSRGHTP